MVQHKPPQTSQPQPAYWLAADALTSPSRNSPAPLPHTLIKNENSNVVPDKNDVANHYVGGLFVTQLHGSTR